MDFIKTVTGSIEAIKPVAKKLVSQATSEAPKIEQALSKENGAQILSSQITPFIQSKKLVPQAGGLFDWAIQRPKISFDKIDSDSFVMVHMTNYFPQNGVINSTRTATMAKDGVGQARNTIHFALNKSVTEHAMGNAWDSFDYAVITPFQKVIQSMPSSKVIGGFQDDFFFVDEVKLPKGSAIIKRNPQVPQGQFQVSDIFEGVKLIETSNPSISTTANQVIQKMGFENYNQALQRYLGANDDEIEYIRKIDVEIPIPKSKEIIDEYINTTKEILESMDGFEDYMSKEQIEAAKLVHTNALNMWETFKKYYDKIQDFPNAWGEFCRENQYINGLHSQTPWYKIESTVWGVEMVEELNKNSWGKYRNFLLDELSEAQKNSPKGKDIGVDISRLAQIIKESETPKEALNKIAQDLKIKPMPGKNPSATIDTSQDIGNTLDVLLATVFQDFILEN